MSERLTFPFSVLADFAVANAIFGAYQAGIFDAFEADIDHVIDTDVFAADRGLAPRPTRGVVEYLARRGYFEPADGKRFRLAPQGRELIAEKWLGYFVFLVGGYGKVLGTTGDLVTQKAKYGVDLRRDGHYVALGSQLQGHHPRHKSFATVVETVNAGKRPETILDIGCGSAEFLLRLVDSFDAHGVGIDVDEASCELARKNVEGTALRDRVRILQGNACAPLEIDPSLAGSVDLVTAMFIIHEFYMAGQSVVIDALRGIARVLRPGAGRLLIMDKQTDILERGEAPAYFTEFKFVHDLTNQMLVNNAHWRQTLSDAGLEIVDEKVLGALTGTVQFVCRVKES